MPRDSTIKKVLVIGSGPIVIGQSAEFDYSGSQACKALREEGVKVILLNSNPATIQTDPALADRIYIEPLQADVLERIIKEERPDGLLATMGGQTALNLAMEMSQKGVLDRYGVRMLGTGIESIHTAEDRGAFNRLIAQIKEPQLDSVAATRHEQAHAFSKTHGFPLILRPAFTLGGTGGGIERDQDEFDHLLTLGFTLSPTHQILIEESVLGWAEFEYEMMRDANDNCITICNMENIDPMGVHTGESVVVAPSQTLSDDEHQMLRSAAIKIIRALKIVGGCNIQFALNQKSGEYIVVEVNPRLSRSSALASKATGYPIARVAAKIALGYSLHEILNAVTQTTPASFEPALDYCVIKIPRWPFDKMPKAERRLGTQMKSTGEVMAIGRTFEEAYLKATRSLEQKAPHLSDADLEHHLTQPTDLRFPAILRALHLGWSGDKIVQLTSIHPWFLDRFVSIVQMEKRLKAEPFSIPLLKAAKRMGFSDAHIAVLSGQEEKALRALRIKAGIKPTYKMVDTCACEFEAKTPYYYSTYESENESIRSSRKKVVIIGSGPIRIGQGIEFDYCACHASFCLKEMGVESILINNNPETISTDFDTSDKLYFEPLTYEEVLNVVEHEQPDGVIVQFGGQTSINLAEKLAAAGVPVLGTPIDGIDLAEDRERFRELLGKLGIAQPKNGTARNMAEALAEAKRVGYPIVVRPSYVIAGRGMAIVYDEEGLKQYIEEAVDVSEKKPVLIDQYIDRAIECEIDGVGDGERLWIAGLMEHIERAGVHSGDASCVVPPVRLKPEVQKKLLEYSRSISKALGIIGAINIQYVVRDDVIFVLEANPRASRTMPYLSKATGIPIVQLATRVQMGEKLSAIAPPEPLALPFYAVKSVVFPFLKLRGADFVLGPEMKSTGESMGIDAEFPIAYYKSLRGANLRLPSKGVVAFSFKAGDQERALPIARKLISLGYSIAATPGTAQHLSELRGQVHLLKKLADGEPNLVSELRANRIQMVFNTPSKGGKASSDGFAIRRASLEANVPCITNFEAAEALVEALEAVQSGEVKPKCLQEYWKAD
ncbi:Pyruvate carboxylase subunit A [uncultured archaeon]|nr:Pyruvate carboxylase subunit A [uncultured archaeon]